MFVVLLRLVLVVGLYLGEFVLSVKDYNVFKVFSFESGFKSVGIVHCAFRIHFFIMILMFVVFDLEVVILVGLVVVDKVYYVVFYILFFFVVGGFLMEWYFGKLVWLIFEYFCFFYLFRFFFYWVDVVLCFERGIKFGIC